MRTRPIITTLFGIAIASGAVFLAKDQLLLNGQGARATENADLVEIYIARSEIAFGQTIESYHVSTHPWPREALPPGAFTDISQLVPNDRQMLRRAKGKFYPGEVLIATKVSNYGEKVTLVQKLGKNTRAMAIKVDAVTAVGGFVTPGDHVDIVLTQGAKDELRAVTILQNIRVIGVDQQSEELKDQPEVARTITVEVMPEQGQRLALAQKAGTLSLTLRTLEEVEDKPMDMVRLQDLLQEEGPVDVVDTRPTVTVRRGTGQSEVITITRNPVEIEPEAEVAPETQAQPETVTEPAATGTTTQSDQTDLSALPQANDDLSSVKPRLRPITITQVIE